MEVEEAGGLGLRVVLGEPVVEVEGSGGSGEEEEAAAGGGVAVCLGEGEEGGPVGAVFVGFGADENLGTGGLPDADDGAF